MPYRVFALAPVVILPLNALLFLTGLVRADSALVALAVLQAGVVAMSLMAYIAGVRAGMPRSETIIVILTLATSYAIIAGYLTLSFSNSSGRLFGVSTITAHAPTETVANA